VAAGVVGVDAGAADAVPPASELVLPAVVLTAGADVPDPAPLRKSVTYQPEPFSWNPAAVTCLTSAAWPQAGQSRKGASDIFCSASWAWPHDSHL